MACGKRARVGCVLYILVLRPRILKLLNYNLPMLYHLWFLFLARTAHCLWHTTFCVVTAGRNVSYVNETVASFQEQRVFQQDGAALVVVDVDGSAGMGSFSVRLDNREFAACNTPDTVGMPSCKVRQMTLDVTSALALCANQTTGWVVLAEDDCVACAGAVTEVIDTLQVLSPLDTAMAKFSKFSRGMAIPAGKVSAFVQFTRSRLYTHPYDITQVENWDQHQGGGRIYVHKRNLFHHIGTVSTERARNTQEFLAQFGEFRSDVCFEDLG